MAESRGVTGGTHRPYRGHRERGGYGQPIPYEISLPSMAWREASGIGGVLARDAFSWCGWDILPTMSGQRKDRARDTMVWDR
jgi:hypothetical protein